MLLRIFLSWTFRGYIFSRVCLEIKFMWVMGVAEHLTLQWTAMQSSKWFAILYTHWNLWRQYPEEQSLESCHQFLTSSSPALMLTSIRSSLHHLHFSSFLARASPSLEDHYNPLLATILSVMALLEQLKAEKPQGIQQEACSPAGLLSLP